MPDGFIFEAGCPVIEWPGCYAGKYLVSVDSVHNFVQLGYLSEKDEFFSKVTRFWVCLFCCSQFNDLDTSTLWFMSILESTLISFCS